MFIVYCLILHRRFFLFFFNVSLFKRISSQMSYTTIGEIIEHYESTPESVPESTRVMYESSLIKAQSGKAPYMRLDGE